MATLEMVHLYWGLGASGAKFLWQGTNAAKNDECYRRVEGEDIGFGALEADLG